MYATIRFGDREDRQVPNAAEERKKCPECGSQLVEETRMQVKSSYPAPQLRLIKCSSEKCSFRDYSKLETL